MTKSATSIRRSAKSTSRTKGKRAGASRASSSSKAARSSSTKRSNKRVEIGFGGSETPYEDGFGPLVNKA